MLIRIGSTDAWNIVRLPTDSEHISQTLCGCSRSGRSSRCVRVGNLKINKIQSKTNRKIIDKKLERLKVSIPDLANARRAFLDGQ